CRLASSAEAKASFHLEWNDVVLYSDGLIGVLIPDAAGDICALRLKRMRECFNDRAYMSLTLRRRPNDQLRLFELANMAAQAPPAICGSIRSSEEIVREVNERAVSLKPMTAGGEVV
ncbi:hypothetical protein CWO89_44035, partial [Bradyrhizobium sp. Leo170]